MDKREYQPLTIPRITWDPKSLTGTFGEFVAQPLEPGFGMTFGNALRRVLLGGAEGSAVTSVIIKGVNNEFSSVPGVLEDTMQLVLNIKQIVIRNKEGKAGKMYMKVTGAGVARVADIKADEHLELVNTEHILAHLAADGDLEIEFFVESGRGYSAAQWPTEKSLQDDSRIYLDAMFSPIKKVTFDVEKTRVGGEIDYDKLICRIHTDGSENPVDALHYAVSILRTQLEHFLAKPEVPFNEISRLPQEANEGTAVGLDKIGIKGIAVDLLIKPIEELELSVRAHNCLVNAGVKRIVDLVNLSEDDILNIKNFGRKSLGEVKDSMKAFGLSFNVDIKESDLEKALEGRSINS